MKHVWKVFIYPFKDDGSFDWADGVEVTEDVVADSISNIQQALNNTQFDVGVLRTNSMNIKLSNSDGKYSDTWNSRSIFKYKRSDSRVQIFWECEEDDGPICGASEVGDTWLSQPVLVFQGIISDETYTMQVEDDTVTFTILGREALLDRGILSSDPTINNMPVTGAEIDSAFYTLLAAAPLQGYAIVAGGTITSGVYYQLGDVSSWENQTVASVLDNLLKITSSILYIDSQSFVQVKPRLPTSDVKYVFNGQGASGAENIQLLGNITNGLARVYNYVTWKDTTLVSSAPSSLIKYGVRKLEISEDTVGTDSYRQASIDALVAEFGTPKQELELTVPISFETLTLQLLDRISIDYPVVYFSNDSTLSLCGACLCGETPLPEGMWSFSIDPSDHYKIMGRTVDIKNGLITFKVREI